MTSPSQPAAADDRDSSPPHALLAAFAEHAAPLGIRVERTADISAAAEIVAALAAELGAPEPILSGELAATAPDLAAALREAGLDWRSPGDPAATRDAPLGLSLAHLAVAETGSVLVAETTLADRAVGMLAVAHLVICPTHALVPSLTEAADPLRAVATRPGGGYATLVTGPSRTADIERVLTVGVQGPARLAILFVDELR
ncbi:MAG: lactate utilization protein [Chloroflexota bacterium]|nr:lactate utilization protein [Chloroflexota bacterium]